MTNLHVSDIIFPNDITAGAVDKLGLLGELRRSERYGSRMYSAWQNNQDDTVLAYSLLEGVPPRIVSGSLSTRVLRVLAHPQFDSMQQAYRKEGHPVAKHEFVLTLAAALMAAEDEQVEEGSDAAPPQHEQMDEAGMVPEDGKSGRMLLELEEEEVSLAAARAAFISVADDFSESPAEFIELLDVMDGVDLKYLTDALGWSRQAMNRGVHTTSTRGAISGVTVGGWDDATAVAKLELVGGDVRREMQLAESTLPAYQREGERVGRGPVVWCSDFSGSMSGSEPQLRALEMATAAGFNDQGRDLVGITFNSSELYRHEWGSGSLQRVTYSGTEEVSGGAARHLRRRASRTTNVGLVFSEAIRVASQWQGAADVVVLTDGKVTVSGDVTDRVRSFRESGSRVVFLLIGDSVSKCAEEGLFDLQLKLSDLEDIEMISAALEAITAPAAGRNAVWK